ncbi:MAG: RluA family pseudouridine synthase [Myxococcota bacterium]|nr:RluA family pseudouridine synthase [Myxococcota bacterium]
MSSSTPSASLTIPMEGEGQRLDAFAAAALPTLLPSRTRARKEAKAGRLLLDGAPAAPSAFLQAGQQLTLLPPPPPARPAISIDIPVLYIDPFFAAVHKPPGLLTNGNRHRTLERALPGVIPPSDAPDALPAPLVVHRLDRPTSGLVLVARTRRAQVSLGRQLEERTLEKLYRAIVCGPLKGAGEVTTPIDGRAARTLWRAVSHTPSLKHGWLTVVALHPETGRTHQLRRHLAGLGHPILGDLQHAPEAQLRGKGLFLFAAEVRLVHPITGAPLHIVAPDPPKFAALLKREARRHARVSDSRHTPEASSGQEGPTP